MSIFTFEIHTYENKDISAKLTDEIVIFTI